MLEASPTAAALWVAATLEHLSGEPSGRSGTEQREAHGPFQRGELVCEGTWTNIVR